MDDLDFFKRTLDLIRIWLQASREVRKFTQPKTIRSVTYVYVMFDNCSTSTNQSLFCKTMKCLVLVSPPNRFDAHDYEVILVKPIAFRDVRSEGEERFVIQKTSQYNIFSYIFSKLVYQGAQSIVPIFLENRN